MVGPVINEKVRKFLMKLFKKCGHISCGNDLLSRSEDLSLKNIRTRLMYSNGTKNSIRVGLAGSTNKRCITFTLTVTLDGKILLFQIIYGGKTDQSLSNITFPAKFSTSVNKKHYSNTEEVIKHLQEIVIPYVNEEREKIGDADQYVLLIWDVFCSQKTEAVTSLLQEEKTLNEYVPNNLADYSEVLDLTVLQIGKGFYETELQRMVRNTVKK